MSFAGQKRPGLDQSGALMHVKMPRQELVAVGTDTRGRQLMQAVGAF